MNSRKRKLSKTSDKRPKVVKNEREAIFYRQQSISELFPLVSGLKLIRFKCRLLNRVINLHPDVHWSAPLTTKILMVGQVRLTIKSWCCPALPLSHCRSPCATGTCTRPNPHKAPGAGKSWIAGPRSTLLLMTFSDVVGGRREYRSLC